MKRFFGQDNKCIRCGNPTSSIHILMECPYYEKERYIVTQKLNASWHIYSDQFLKLVTYFIKEITKEGSNLVNLF